MTRSDYASSEVDSRVVAGSDVWCGELALPRQVGSGRNCCRRWVPASRSSSRLLQARGAPGADQGAAHLPAGARLRAGMPPMRESAGEFITKLRDDARYLGIATGITRRRHEPKRGGKRNHPRQR